MHLHSFYKRGIVNKLKLEPIIHAIHLHRIGVNTEITETDILKPGQVKPKEINTCPDTSKVKRNIFIIWMN